MLTWTTAEIHVDKVLNSGINIAGYHMKENQCKNVC